MTEMYDEAGVTGLRLFGLFGFEYKRSIFLIIWHCLIDCVSVLVECCRFVVWYYNFGSLVF